MVNDMKSFTRRMACKRLFGRMGLASVWSTPIVQAVILPTHAHTSVEVCSSTDVVGQWKIELFGVAAATKEIVFFDDGTTDQSFVPFWQFSNGKLTLAQGITWLLTGNFNGCDELTGSYVNTLVIPPLGNIVVRRGNWIATRL